MSIAEEEAFKPHVAAETQMREFTPRSILLGLLFGLLFAVANAYLALKVGSTVSASIPAAIMSMAILRTFFRNATILENNIVQTIATVGETLAAGVVFTIPALILLGESPSIGRIFLLTALGGLLGILFMIPMRRFIIVQEHKKLPFPEGTACAEILKAGESNSKSAILAVWGFLGAAIFKICCNVFFLWSENISWVTRIFKRAEISFDVTPALLGVGYIVGYRITALMFAGSVLAWWVIIPLIIEFGTGTVSIYPSTTAITAMSSEEIWAHYVRYIGAGCLALGGLASLVRIAPVIFRTIHTSFKELFGGFNQRANLKRTEQDISLSWLIIGSIAIILFLWLFPTLPMNLLTILLLVVLGFFFVAVTSLTVGLIGATSNPVSGMIITTLLITCLVFVLLGWTERIYLISAMTMGVVACCAIAVAGTTAQDLKAGYILGATPKSQQIAEIIGLAIPALALGYTVYILNKAYGFGSAAMPAPQATLMSLIVKGVISGDLPYMLVGIGTIIGATMLLLGIPVLPFALGLYLPLSLTTAMMVGALMRAYVDQKSPGVQSQERGILFASGLIGGDACIGILIAVLAVLGVIPTDAPGLLPSWVGLAAYLLLAFALAAFTARKKGLSSS